MCKQVVQGINIAAIYGWWRIMNILLIIKWSHVDVMRPSLSLGAWWPGEETLPKSLFAKS